MASISVLENAIEEVSLVDYFLSEDSKPCRGAGNARGGISTSMGELCKILKIRSSVRSKASGQSLHLNVFHAICGSPAKENNNELKVSFIKNKGVFLYFGSYEDPDYTSDDDEDIHATDVVSFSGRKSFPSIEEAFEHFWHHTFLRKSGILEASQKLQQLRLLSETVLGLRLEPSSHFFGVPRDIVQFCILPFL